MRRFAICLVSLVATTGAGSATATFAAVIAQTGFNNASGINSTAAVDSRSWRE